MQIDTCHFGIHVHSLDEALDYYVGTLGFEILQFMPQIGLAAIRAGGVRLSMIADATKEEVAAAAKAGGSPIFRTEDLDGTLAALAARGVAIPPVMEAPGFMRFVSLRDPSGNLVQIAQYLRDPLAVV